jgi:transcriptional regulator with XRE-family HTH domain
MTQEQLSVAAGLHRTYVNHVEAGRRNASLDNIEKLALALDVNVAELLLPLTGGPDS